MRNQRVVAAAKKLLGSEARYTGGTWRRGDTYLRVGKVPGWSDGRDKHFVFSVRVRTRTAENNVRTVSGARSSEPDYRHGYSYDYLIKRKTR